MNIRGLQKLTLLDYPGKTACTVFLGGCNFRCPFCHNSGLLEANRPAALSPEEFWSFLDKRRAVLDGVCVTGGEPLLQPDLEDFLREIKRRTSPSSWIPTAVSPPRLRALTSRGLVDYVAMDIKNAPSRYAETAGLQRMDLSPLSKSIRYLLAGHVEYEFRTTVVRELHTRSDLEAIGRWIEGASRYYLQSFVASDQVLSPVCIPAPRRADGAP